MEVATSGAAHWSPSCSRARRSRRWPVSSRPRPPRPTAATPAGIAQGRSARRGRRPRSSNCAPASSRVRFPSRTASTSSYLRDKRAGGGGQLVNLKQIAVGLPARRARRRGRRGARSWTASAASVTSCVTSRPPPRASTALLTSDLGEAEVKDLIPDFQQAANTLQIGQVSPRSAPPPACTWWPSAASAPPAGRPRRPPPRSRTACAASSWRMIARRYLRDLRNSATIETR
jgi:peptidyl-prolyl cis-trans isomerase SurA